MSFEAQLARKYADVRARLMGKPEPVKRAVIVPVPKPCPIDIEVDVFNENWPHWRKIAHEVARKHGMTFRQLRRTRTARRFVAVRYEAYWRIHSEVRIGENPPSLNTIARWFGLRDHASVMRGIQLHEQRIIDEGLARVGEAFSSLKEVVK